MKAKLSLTAASMTAFALSASAQVAFEGEYSQEFNTLANSGTANTWSDNVTLDGWYASRTAYIADAGTSTDDQYAPVL